MLPEDPYGVEMRPSQIQCQEVKTKEDQVVETRERERIMKW